MSLGDGPAGRLAPADVQARAKMGLSLSTVRQSFLRGNSREPAFPNHLSSAVGRDRRWPDDVNRLRVRLAERRDHPIETVRGEPNHARIRGA